MSRDSNKKPGLVERTLGKVRDAGASALRGLADKLEAPKATFEIAETKIDFGVDVAGDTLWATQTQIAELFGVSVKTVSEHLRNAFREGELDEASVVRNLRITAADGKDYNTLHYNLDAILAVGTRVRSPRATQFRQWAFRILKDYVVHGYALNEERLRNDPAAAQSLAEKVREIRFDEKNLYARVRDCVAAVASDYDGSSDEIRKFFAKMQDKFHFAACEQTAQQLLLTRADGTKDRMGMTTQLNARPTLADAKIAKNYLSPEELKLQMLAGEAFFVYVENMIARDRTMTTSQLLAKIDEVFKFNEIPQFPGYVGPYRKPAVEAHVKAQYELFKTRTAQDRYDEARRLPPA
ncbi:virulence RhuM family protein [Methylobacterium sp. J-078]|uniref:RhuM family protein n=1 Tax=Methylobacterium sp. J-078 TaxID=2836657 RepID=UPI001FBB9D93|nr:RhuM family protein [Methylobacterium sp. J-078]MCJ2043020.1 virulence RhuM family protein [Methylobacterium sp. J-078]